MRKRMPTITASADALHQRLKQEQDVKKRQRLQALYLAASGRAHHRQEIADLLGVHRHSVAAWFAAYAEGGIDKMLRYQVPRPPLRQRITAPALMALQAKLQAPHGLASYHQIRLWLAEEPQGSLAYSSVHALVRYKLHAKPTRPRPSHGKKVPMPCPSFRPPCRPSSPSSLKPARQAAWSRSLPKTKPGSAYCPSSGVALPPVGCNLSPR
jgi:transposase